MCVRLFGDSLGVILEVFWEDFEGKLSTNNKNHARTLFFYNLKIALNSIFNEYSRNKLLSMLPDWLHAKYLVLFGTDVSLLKNNNPSKCRC